jgi:hypothetical protein
MKMNTVTLYTAKCVGHAWMALPVAQPACN